MGSKGRRAGQIEYLAQAYRLHDAPGHLLRRCQQRAIDIYFDELGEAGPTPRQFAALVTIGQNPGINQTELVQITGIDRSTVGDLVVRLVKRGWIRRRRTDRDGRTNALHITDVGLQVLERAIPAVDRAQDRIVAPLPPAMRDAFVACLRRLANLPERESSVKESA